MMCVHRERQLREVEREKCGVGVRVTYVNSSRTVNTNESGFVCMNEYQSS